VAGARSAILECDLTLLFLCFDEAEAQLQAEMTRIRQKRFELADKLWKEATGFHG